jgi:hypothetical protein
MGHSVTHAVTNASESNSKYCLGTAKQALDLDVSFKSLYDPTHRNAVR